MMFVITKSAGRAATVLTCALLWSGQAAWAQSGENPDKWKFEITPYLFASSLNGTVGLRGVEADVDIPFEDIFERLDQAFMLFATAEKNDWIYMFDGMYMKLEDEQANSWTGPLGNTNTGQLKVNLKEEIYSLSAGRRIGGAGPAKLHLMGVARYTNVEPQLSLSVTTGGNLLPSGARSVSGSYDWWDAAIALRFVTPFAEKWDFSAYGDVGAGGSDLTYQFLAGVNWRFSKTFSGKFGYRYLKTDYSKDDFKYDMAMSGLFAGLGIRW
jgi:opacity protein-like surface antigen